MKAVLISIQPKWCELIASGKKTIEVRKTRPKIETPFKCYIYCTKQRNVSDEYWVNRNRHIYIDNGKVIGEFVCDKIYDITPVPYYEETCGYKIPQAVIDDSCLTAHDIIIYLTRKDTRVNAYGWHISDLKIYDKPKELGEFRKPCNHINDCCTCKEAEFQYDGDELRGLICKREIPLTRPPQSWCYVEELQE